MDKHARILHAQQAPRRTPWSRIAALLFSALAAGGAGAEAPAAEAMAGEHCEHMQAPAPRSGMSIRDEQHVVPTATLIDQDGRELALAELLGDGRPVVMQFIFTTCTTICPLLSGSLSAAQRQLGEIDPTYRLVSISVDPERDTPAALRSYATRHRARDNWIFLTGDKDTIRAVQKAFGAYYEGNNKMYHQPYTFLHGGHGGPWRRITGFASNAELVASFRELVATDYRASTP